jgi:heptosyltransferase-2
MVAFYSALSGDTDLAGDQPKLHLAATEVDMALAAMGLRRGIYHVFVPGAEYGPAKRWPAAHFAELAGRLEVPVVLLGSAKESGLCHEIATVVNAQQPGKCINLAGKTSLAQAFSAIAGAQYMVSNDSGLMHVAAALGINQVAIFGSSSPLHTPPLNAKATVLWLKNDSAYRPALDCAPCFERECPLGHTRCLVDIKAGDVLAHVSLENPPGLGL